MNEQTNMAAHYEHEIHEGYEAKIEGNKVIIELKESEDERVRKEIIDYFYGCIRRNSKSGFRWEQYKSWIAYLEKQKEQKPNIELIQRSWYMEGYHDGEFSREPKWIIKPGKGGPKYEKNEKYGQPLEQKPTNSEKPKEWSEEDETRFINIIIMLKEYVIHHYSKDDVNKSVNWLEDRVKFLRPQPHWKPSAEQMDALNQSLSEYGIDGDVYRNLCSLYDDLSRL